MYSFNLEIFQHLLCYQQLHFFFNMLRFKLNENFVKTINKKYSLLFETSSLHIYIYFFLERSEVNLLGSKDIHTRSTHC